MSVTTLSSSALAHRQPSWLVRLFDYKPFLIVMCLAPAIGLLTVFLTYPLGLGIWLAFTDTTIGRRGVYVGLENFQYLLTDPLWWNAVFYSVVYTGIATFGKFALGFWLAAASQQPFSFKSCCVRSSCCPDRADRAVGAGVLVDLRSAILDHLLPARRRAALAVEQYRLPRSPWPARFSLIVATSGAHSLRRDLAAGGLQTISPSLYEAAMLDGASAWQRFRYITFPMMMPILAIVMTFSIIFTFTDFQLVYAITRGGPATRRICWRTLAFQRGIAGGGARRRCGDRGVDDSVPGVRDAVLLFRPGAPQMAAGRRQ